MKYLVPYLLFCFTVISRSLISQSPVTLLSPNNSIAFHYKIDKSRFFYSVTYKNKPVVEYSPLSLHFADEEFKNNLILNKPILKDTTDEYDLLLGKTSHVKSRYKDVLLPLEQTTGLKRKINIRVRLFDDGVAFRYEMPLQPGWTNYTLIDENSTFRLSGDPKAMTLYRRDYTTSHEGYYDTIHYKSLKQDTLMDLPVLFEYPGSIYLSITEAALLDYAGMYLYKQGDTLFSKLSPLPNQSGIKVKAKLPHHTPWRVLLISDRIGALIESTIITTLNEPCKLDNTSWIKPGKTTFPWWNGNVVPDTLQSPGNNLVTNQYYIDFCARNKIEYHSIVEYGLNQWYQDDGEWYFPGPHADVTTPVQELDIKAVCDYAHSVGVMPRIWVHWYALYPKLDTAFALYEKWGLTGMMVDFMDRDDQEMVNMQTEVLEKAAKHKLHIQWHGAYKPTGINRTYPHELTKEGVMNYEYNKWIREGISVDHDITIPFTRMIAGSTDYHLGGFRAGKFYTPHFTRPITNGTRSHLLAMYVVLESYLQMVADHPGAYEGEPGFEFITEVPTTWDETKVLDAKLNEYIIIARRKADTWYIGGITNHKAREVSISFDFLMKETAQIKLYQDALDGNANHLIQSEKNIFRNEVLKIKLDSGGGMVMIVK